ncbi:MAG TPA: hypothetical protein PL009_07735 [Flavipsychrobacter sp.]|nr:hypothetical protein [Flavipsychrobacter sp.]
MDVLLSGTIGYFFPYQTASREGLGGTNQSLPSPFGFDDYVSVFDIVSDLNFHFEVKSKFLFRAFHNDEQLVDRLYGCFNLKTGETNWCFEPIDDNAIKRDPSFFIFLLPYPVIEQKSANGRWQSINENFFKAFASAKKNRNVFDRISDDLSSCFKIRGLDSIEHGEYEETLPNDFKNAENSAFPIFLEQGDDFIHLIIEWRKFVSESLNFTPPINSFSKIAIPYFSSTDHEQKLYKHLTSALYSGQPWIVHWHRIKRYFGCNSSETHTLIESDEVYQLRKDDEIIHEWQKGKVRGLYGVYEQKGERVAIAYLYDISKNLTSSMMGGRFKRAFRSVVEKYEARGNFVSNIGIEIEKDLTGWRYDEKQRTLFQL